MTFKAVKKESIVLTTLNKQIDSFAVWPWTGQECAKLPPAASSSLGNCSCTGNKTEITDLKLSHTYFQSSPLANFGFWSEPLRLPDISWA